MCTKGHTIGMQSFIKFPYFVLELQRGGSLPPGIRTPRKPRGNRVKVGSTNKLTPNLLSRENYAVHYRDLQYYLSKGLILTKAHRILEFKQSARMRPYIDFNTERRKEATKEADKNLFKKLNNAVYGKTMENMRKIIKIRIAKTPKDFLKLSSRPTYISHNIFGKNLVAINEKNY